MRTGEPCCRAGRLKVVMAAVALPFSAVMLALAGCGGTAAAAHSPAATHSPGPVSTLSVADAGRVCAALNALEHGGSSKAAADRTAQGAYHLSAADVARARRIRCPGD